ncbi:hypothetical protein V6N13_067268 [Hibiscus sabdariffa]|uniref:Uncharacterized protein n=1 Tax=Hibiscus sabdariffa TaxID=183260 RepID=A0ABR2DW59_9ROSI
MDNSVRPFGPAGLLLLAALTASMLFLPLVLPPLPPPPLLLLFIPVGLMAALVFLALSPADAMGNVAVHTL